MTDMIDLSGSWRYRTDENDEGIIAGYAGEVFAEDGFMLPGSSCENKVGKEREYKAELDKETVRAPRERFEYIGPLWLQRDVDIPESFTGIIRMYLERVNIASELWIDGEKVGRRIIELSAPHIYDLTGKLAPGKHVITLRIDNRNLLNIDTMASGYSVDTQGYWNGVIGRIELRREELFRVENIQVYPQENGIHVRLCETSDVYSPFERRDATLTLSVTDPDGNTLGNKAFERELYNSRQTEHLFYEMNDIRHWDEFDPALYTLNVRYECQGVTDEKQVRFGMRTIRRDGKKMLINGRQLSLRGTIDCAIYPITGYPPMDKAVWLENFKTIQSYGLNHVRFHAWCPPECAFEAADELGVYVSVEMPLWLNRDVCALELGEDPIHRDYFTREAVTISKTYGNHPSFIMFSNGNENMGDFELLEDITTQIKALDPRRLYTVTSNFDHPVLPCEDYLCAYEAGGHRVRIQTMQDEAAESTCTDYSAAVGDVPVPIISFEVGQYCVYPDVDIIERYTGNMMPVNFYAIREEMRKKGVYGRLGDYTKASGDLAVKLYKEDIECALRTKDFGGFELLSLCDYTGQSTATVGILDVMFESKGLITPEKFRTFCGDVVPLFMAKRVFMNDETLDAKLGLYDFGKDKTEPVFTLEIYNGDELFYSTVTEDTRVSIPLGGITRPSKLDVRLTVGEYTNSWNIYVYTNDDTAPEVKTVTMPEELKEIIENGGRAVVTADAVVSDLMDGSFIPVFWSPVHFPSQKPCGAMIDDEHPIFDGFPTDKYPDFQWKKPLDNSRGMDISRFEGLRPIIETVPNYVDNTPGSPLFEMRIGKAELLFCGFELSLDDPVSRCLRSCIYRYVSSERFKPEYETEPLTFIGTI